MVENLTCPFCRQEHPVGARFCPVTGKELPPSTIACPSCGTRLAMEANFCPNCGTSLVNPQPNPTSATLESTKAARRGLRAAFIIIIPIIIILCLAGVALGVWKFQDQFTRYTGLSLPKSLTFGSTTTWTPSPEPSLTPSVTFEPTFTPSPIPAHTFTETPFPPTMTPTTTTTPTITMTQTSTMINTLGGLSTYTVQIGDTCGSLAVIYNTDINSIITLNPNVGQSCTINPGDKLLLPFSSQQLPTATPLTSGLAGGTRIKYTVMSGETLGAIAYRFGSTVVAILNDPDNAFLNNKTTINAGQVITIPANIITPISLFVVSITASKYDPNGTDAGNNPMNYVPENAVDGDNSTAWRVAGDGSGQWLLLDFGKDVILHQIGVIPGYDKIDLYDGTDRFLQNRVLKQVHFQFSDGSTLDYNFIYDRAMQWIPIEDVRTKTIKLTVISSYPPRLADSWNAIAISEIELTGWLP